MIFFCIPFSQILGLSAFFGLVIAYLGISYAFAKKPWLPKFILKRKISAKILKFMINQLLFFIKILAKLSHPRLLWVTTSSSMRKINGCLISLIGIFLAISLPLPLSSYIASAALLFLGIGLLNDDGMWMFIGYPIALFYIVFVILTTKHISLTDLFHR